MPGCQAPPPRLTRFRAPFPRGCQARRHDVEDNIMPGCQAPPPRLIHSKHDYTFREVIQAMPRIGTADTR
jgi:hypothetical protein